MMRSAYRYWQLDWADGSNRFSIREMALQSAARLCAEGYEVTIIWHDGKSVSQEDVHEPAGTD